ncbi:alpha-L-glutamate ligase [Tersicoccus phoenicis]|uniref:Alpha-L-glutamate ligase n=1 Tax=Tersicoccus phoenicis TaxID=554083 RepID=A0A1R1LGR5_9MICC|nr:alpha-L-glutamate ligase [Tersicoccus phoenicis]OMH26692.1 alpha-L-glutamate ligase [Tersicoccus phoenicis]
MTTPTVHVIHENGAWMPPFRAAFEAEGVPLTEIDLSSAADGGAIDLGAEPAPGIYWSRMSASAHTRGNTHAKEYTRAVLRWLESWGRRVVNGSGVLELEVSKVAQHGLLRSHGFDVPRTTAAFGREGLVEAARAFEPPFIAKHNQGGKGLGVRRFDSHADLDAYVASDEFEQPVDGITLVQEYLAAREPFITRAEFVGGRFVYAVRVDTSAGSFELCPADACVVPDSADDAAVAPFALRADIDAAHPLVRRYEALLAEAGIEIAGIEFIETVDGRTVTYDVNTNTNYNPDVEAASPVSGPRSIARFLGGLLAVERVTETQRA